ncbi:MAG: O-antigen ligase family protein [Terracidiphilus sp.]|jgi:O-antigen ligase
MMYPLACAALVLVLAYVYVLFRWPFIGLVSLLAGEFIDFAFGLNNRLIGGIHLDPLDAISICLLFAGLFRSFQHIRRINVMTLLCLGYLLLFAMSFGRGIAANGFFAAANESRGFIGPLTAMLYFVTVPADPRALRKYTLAYLYFGAALCIAAGLAAAGLPIGLNAMEQSDVLGLDGRYLAAGAAAAIAVCGFLSLAVFRHKSTGLVRPIIPIAFLCVAVYLRHRTVWMMLLVGALAFLPLDKKLFLRLLPAAALAALMVIGLATYGKSVNGLVSEEQFSTSATNFDTLSWRLNGWKDLLFDSEQTPLTVAVGKSMGGGYWRVDPVSYEITSVAPHSEYVQEYLRVGLVGTLLIFCFLLRPLLRLWKLGRHFPFAAYPTTSAWTVITLITLLYGVTYGIQPHSYALIAIANAFLSSLSAQRVDAYQLAESQWQVTSIAGNAA